MTILRKEIGIVRWDRVADRLDNLFTYPQCLSEIIKNSNDEYSTISEEIEEEERLIIVMVVQNTYQDYMLILDVGDSMTPDEMHRWASWAEESEDRQGEGDQGLGGKTSMRKLASEQATITCFKNGQMTEAGFYKTEDGRLTDMALMEFYEKLQDNGEQIPVSTPFDSAIDALNSCLERSNASLDSQWTSNNPDIAFDPDGPRQHLLKTIEKRGSWTLIEISDLSDFIPHSGSSRNSHRKHNEAVYDLIESLKSEGQARMSLQDSYVFFIKQETLGNGRILSDVELLEELLPEPLEGIESKEIEIKAQTYIDPVTGREYAPDGPGFLELHASTKVLQGDRWSSLKGIRINDGRNNVWIENVPTGSDSGAALRIYGRFTTPSRELSQLATIDRRTAPSHGIARAIREVITPHLEEFRGEIAAVIRSSTESRRSDSKIQNELDKRMERIEQLVDLDSIFNDGDDEGGENLLAPEITEIFLGSKSSPLNKAHMLSGTEYNIAIHPMGLRSNDVLTYLSELKGVRDRSPYFEVSSDNEEIVDFIVENGKFMLIANNPGKTVVSIKSSVELTGFAESELEITVVDLQNDPIISFDPEPGPRGVISDINIQAEGGNGENYNQDNTLFEVSVVGSGSIHSRYPLRLKTSIAEPAPGMVKLKWSKENECRALFETTEEIHIPTPLPPKNKGRKFPRVIVCGQPSGIESEPEMTHEEDPGMVTIIENPFWEQYGIKWLNLVSPESRAKLRGNDGNIASQNSEIYSKYLDHQTIEVAIRHVMSQGVIEGTWSQPQTVGEIHTLRTNAEYRLDSLFEALTTGAIRENGDE